MKYNIFVKNKNKSKECIADKHLMDSLSVCTDLVPKGCHNGACGICKVRVLSGKYTKLKMNRKHITKEEEENNIILSCKVLPESDMTIEFLPKRVKKLTEKVYVLGN